MSRDAFNQLRPSPHGAEMLASIALYGPPFLAAAVAFLLARRGTSWTASLWIGFFAGFALLAGGFMIDDVAEMIGPMVLAAVPYFAIVVGFSFAGAKLGSRAARG